MHRFLIFVATLVQYFKSLCSVLCLCIVLGGLYSLFGLCIVSYVFPPQSISPTNLSSPPPPLPPGPNGGGGGGGM